jgi:hypothetical protein
VYGLPEPALLSSVAERGIVADQQADKPRAAARRSSTDSMAT